MKVKLFGAWRFKTFKFQAVNGMDNVKIFRSTSKAKRRFNESQKLSNSTSRSVNGRETNPQ